MQQAFVAIQIDRYPVAVAIENRDPFSRAKPVGKEGAIAAVFHPNSGLKTYGQRSNSLAREEWLDFLGHFPTKQRKEIEPVSRVRNEAIFQGSNPGGTDNFEHRFGSIKMHAVGRPQ